MVRTAVRTITLNIYQLRVPELQVLLTSPPYDFYFDDLVQLLNAYSKVRSVGAYLLWVLQAPAAGAAVPVNCFFGKTRLCCP